MNLLITFPIPDAALQKVKSLSHFKSVEYYPSTYIHGSKHPKANWNHEPADIPDAVWAQTDVLQTMFRVPEHAAQAPRLQLIQGMSAGVEFFIHAPFFQEARAAGRDETLQVCSASGIHSTKIAEYVLLQTLSMCTRLPLLLALAGRRRWERTAYVPAGDLSGASELRGKTMGILGYGCIGREAGRLAAAFGMLVTAATSTGEKQPARGFIIDGTGDADGAIPQRWYKTSDAAALHRFLAEVDVLVLACPLTAATRHIVSASSIRHLKAEAFIINIARGGLIDHDALIAALEEGRLAAACLDVTDPEPLPEGHRLWTTKNCFITPHIAGATEHYVTRCIELLDANVTRLSERRDLLNLVDLKKGY